jgi:hypothetical protein
MHAFQECYVFTSINHESHLHYLQTQSLLTDANWLLESQGFMNAFFTRCEGLIYDAMQRSATYFEFHPEEDFIVSVQHKPLLLAMLTSEIFLVPSGVRVFTSLDQSLDSGLQSDESGSSVVSALPMKLVETVAGIPSQPPAVEMDRDFKLLGASLNSLLEALGHKDEIFALGKSSKQLAKYIVAQSTSATRRNSETNLAVVLVDRTLDLASATCHHDNLVDRLYHTFEQHKDSTDLYISSRHLFQGAPNFSLSHGMDQEAMDLLQVLCNLDYRNAMVVIRYEP